LFGNDYGIVHKVSPVNYPTRALGEFCAANYLASIT
jgi:hypothetical protein